VYRDTELPVVGTLIEIEFVPIAAETEFPATIFEIPDVELPTVALDELPEIVIALDVPIVPIKPDVVEPANWSPRLTDNEPTVAPAELPVNATTVGTDVFSVPMPSVIPEPLNESVIA
jgi:hypothetical protein